MTDEPRFRGEASALIDAPADAVFDLITDVRRLPEWNNAIENIVAGPGVLSDRAEWVVTMHPPGLPRWRSRSTVRLLDGDARQFVYASTSVDTNPSYIDWFWHVVDRGGRSDVSVRWHGYPLTLFRRYVAAPMRRRHLAREVPASLHAIAAALRTTVA